MKFKSISFYLGLFCFPISFLSFINILYSSYFDFFLSLDAYLITLFISFILGSGLCFYGKKSFRKINFIEQLILIILVYLLIGLLISLPFYLSNLQINFISAYFEAISGMTGTGFSIFKNIKYLDPTLILWRSSSQWVGGLYFLIFLILLFSNKSFNFKMTQITFSGDTNFNSEESIKNNIIKILIFYIILSFIFLSVLSFSNIRLFNSLNLSMTLISGGGFLPTNSLNNIITSNLQKLILIFLLTLSMLNFYLLFNFFDKRKLKKHHKEDLYLIIAAIIFTLLIFFNEFDGLNLIVSIISSMANSGLSLIKSENNLNLYFLLITIIGGSLISNSSGIKLARFYILLKITSSEIIKLISPNSIINRTIFNSENKISDDNVKISFLIFISFFLGLFILSSLLTIDEIGFERSFKLSILTLTNTVNSQMYGLENLNFENLLTSSKISLIIFMIIGKIELVSIFLIFKKLLFKD